MFTYACVRFIVFHTHRLFIVFPEPCSWGHYDKCKPWSACTVTCGGGTRKRLCESCFWSIDKWYTENCNELCLNGGRYSGGCNCPSWRSGHCCEGINITFLMLWSQKKLTLYDFSDLHITSEFDSHPGSGRFLRSFSCVVMYLYIWYHISCRYMKTSADA